MRIRTERVKKKITILVVFSLLGYLLLPTWNTRAASLTSVSDTMSRLKVSVASDHTIKFTSPTGVAAAGTVTVTFPTGFTIGSTDYTDVDVTWGPTTGAENPLTLGAVASGTTWGLTIAGTPPVLTLTSGTGTITAASKIIISVGLNATGGDAQLTNNSTTTSQIISIAGTFGDTGSLAILLITDDQIPVTASVDPTISFTVANTTLALGTLTSSAIGTSSYNNITIGTNAHVGYTISVRDIGNNSNPGLWSVGSSHLIASSTATLAAGTEGYGGQCNVSSASGTCSFATAGENVTGFTLAGGTFASYGSKPTGTETFQIRVKATVSTSTEAGSYADTLTVIGTANF